MAGVAYRRAATERVKNKNKLCTVLIYSELSHTFAQIGPVWIFFLKCTTILAQNTA